MSWDTSCRLFALDSSIITSSSVGRSLLTVKTMSNSSLSLSHDFEMSYYLGTKVNHKASLRVVAADSLLTVTMMNDL